MRRTYLRYALLYGGVLALVAMALQWAQYRNALMSMPGEIHIGLVAVVFIAIGIWIGLWLTPRSPAGPFERNEQAIRSLGLTRRECEILDHLARGDSNKEIARALGVSPNTIKTHIANLFIKLEVTGRGKAVEAARALALIP